MIQRHSSRRHPLDAAFLNQRLADAKSYDRIAGYFSSSILEVAGEALESVQGPIRVVCNSQLSRADVDVAKLAQAAMRREWCESRPETLGENARPRFQRLYDFLCSGKLEIRVLPDDVFGLIHGKKFKSPRVAEVGLVLSPRKLGFFVWRGQADRELHVHPRRLSSVWFRRSAQEFRRV